MKWPKRLDTTTALGYEESSSAKRLAIRESFFFALLNGFLSWSRRGKPAGNKEMVLVSMGKNLIWLWESC